MIAAAGGICSLIVCGPWQPAQGSIFESLGKVFPTARNRVQVVSQNGLSLAGMGHNPIPFEAGGATQATERIYLRKPESGPKTLEGYDQAEWIPTTLRGLSNTGRVVVGELARKDNRQQTQAYLWTEQTGVRFLSDYGAFSAAESQAAAVSGEGTQVVGTARRSADSPSTAFLWERGGEATWLDGASLARSSRTLVADTYASQGNAISFDGSTVTGTLLGYEQSIPGDPATLVGSQAFLRSADGKVSFPVEQNTGNSRGMLLSPDGGSLLGVWGAASETTTAVSGELKQGFIWDAKSGFQDLGQIHLGDRIVPVAVSDQGKTVVGNFYRPPLDETRRLTSAPFIWQPGRGMLDLQKCLEEDYGFRTALSGWTLTSVTGISGSGDMLVGRGINPDGVEEDWRATLLPMALTADADFDGAVELDDMAILRRNFGKGQHRSQGDFNQDGMVDVLDFVELRLQYGRRMPVQPYTYVLSIPEPAAGVTSGVLALCWAIIQWFRPRRRAVIRLLQKH